MKRRIIMICATVLPLASTPAASFAQQGPTLTVDASSNQHPISPGIYGVNALDGMNADDGLTAELHLPVRRWGGNSTSRYNWQHNMHTAVDWYFENIPDGDDVTDGSLSDLFVEQNKSTNTQSLVTIPMIGWTAKSDSPRTHPNYDCSFKVSKYGTQTGTDSEWEPDCGTGMTDAGPITGNDPADTSTAINTTSIINWINHLTAKYGTAANGGVAYYSLDNEPGLWNQTHRDVHPGAEHDSDFVTLTSHYAAAIKGADPSAKTLGPAEDGWCRYFYSAFDNAQDKDNCGAGPDHAAHGDYVPWYLKMMQSYEQVEGYRILDYLDLHYYPQANGVSLSPAGDSVTQALRLRSTRALWDAAYVDESWIGTEIKLIPRMKAWVADNYPGTKIAISEYNWGGLEDINGALAQADVLGIFGREGVDLATLWAPPAVSDPGSFAFRIYLNYDGAGHGFGDISTQAASSDQDKLSIYAAKRSSADKALTIMVINKTGEALTSTVNLAGFTPGANASVYRYSAAQLASIEHVGNQAVNASGFTATFPGNSITLFVIQQVSTPGTAGSAHPAILKLLL